jgi:hypothetical protein
LLPAALRPLRDVEHAVVVRRQRIETNLLQSDDQLSVGQRLKPDVNLVKTLHLEARRGRRLDAPDQPEREVLVESQLERHAANRSS